MVTILYFGVLRERLACDHETLPWQGGTVATLLSLLRDRGEPWEGALAPEQIYRVAVNRTILHGDGYIPAEAEVGILPPVTGG